MRLIPNYPFNNNSSAELMVFDALKEVQFDDHEAVAFHSLMLTSHQSKRTGEADFVIICKYGIFVLEVKGGGISVENGVWYSKNNHDNHTIQDPFKQAHEAVYALDNKLKNALTVAQKRLPLGYAVVFPNADWLQDGAEWDRAMICDRKNLQNFSGWLMNLFKYWNKERHNNNKLLQQKDIDIIGRYLRPDFEIIDPLFDHVRSVAYQVIKFTKEQYHFVDTAVDNKRIICSGGAGTGKTFLAAELCKRLIDSGKQVLLVCKSPWLQYYLHQFLDNSQLAICTISALPVYMRRNAIKYFDVLIVDEGQDLLNMRDINLLDNVLNGGWKNGQWYFFHDVNNQANLFNAYEPESLQFLKSCNNPAILKLHINCRNTTNILRAIQQHLDCDLGKATLLDGPSVIEFKDCKENMLENLNHTIEELIQSQLELGDITILSPFTWEKSIASKLPAETQHYISKLDEYSVSQRQNSSISFAQIENFKGLENDIILLVDLDEPYFNSENHVLYYVGMSRARAMLYCFWGAP